MKHKRKLGMALLSLSMIMSLCTGLKLHAAEKDTPEYGSITVHKLKVDSEEEYEKLVNDLNNKGTGNELTGDKAPKQEPLQDITFKLTKVLDDGSTLDVNTVKSDPSFTPLTGTTDEKGITKFDKLPLGIYKLEEMKDDSVLIPMDPVLIEIPTYNPEYKDDNTKEEFLYNVHVYPKNVLHPDGPVIGKDVMVEGNNDASVDMFAPFPWIITSEIPEGVAKGQQYTITDKLDSRLDYVEAKDVAVAYRLKGAANNKNDIALAAGDYTKTYDAATRMLTIDLTAAGLTKLGNAEGGYLVVTFYTQLNANVNMGTSIENQAQLEYQNEAGNVYKPKSDKPEVHTGGINIMKVDKSDPTLVLSGAEFKIYASEADAKNQENAIKQNGTDYIAVSGNDGIASFRGLNYGENGGNTTTDTKHYWILETKAPKGYNRLNTPIEVIVTATSHNDTKTYTIKNVKDNFELPFTGGVGSIVFVAGGVILLGAALILLKKDKKVKS